MKQRTEAEAASWVLGLAVTAPSAVIKGVIHARDSLR
jgi:hypothetical protein